MHITRKITQDVVWVGANDRRLQLFESVYPVPNGVSYNSYLVLDDKTVLLDTVDKAVGELFFENLAHELGGRKLDYVVVNHMEPDHAATLQAAAQKYPEAEIWCTAAAKTMIQNFFPSFDMTRVHAVGEGETLLSGKHEFSFVKAPMVHWPEVMVTYDKTAKILFSADAFGTFGALDGKLFADETDFWGSHLGEARRYYTNIVGKYGPQVAALLSKAAQLEIDYVCPLHGFVWRKDFDKFAAKYALWAQYQPERKGVLICYTSVYGNTERACERLAARLCETGVEVKMMDASFYDHSEMIAAAFEYSHIVVASTTYNMGIFVNMDNFLNDLVAHNLQNRKLAAIGNGSWAPVAPKLIVDSLSRLKNCQFVAEPITVKSSPDQKTAEEIDALARVLSETAK